MKKKNKSVITLSILSGLLIGCFSIFAFENENSFKPEAVEAAATLLNSSNFPSTIITEDTSEANIRSYYQSLNGMSVSERKGTNLLKNLKTITQDGSYYCKYADTWKWFLITDRDWTLSPLASTTNYAYNDTPYAHLLYRTDNGSSTATINVTNNHGLGNTPTVTGIGIDREHVWPKSKGFPTDYENKPAGTDLHHLMLGDSKNNQAGHSNYAWGDTGDSYATVSGITQSYNTGAKVWTVGSSKCFEPQDEFKGDIARACFYMVARYNNYAGLSSSDFGTIESNLSLSESLSTTSIDSTDSTQVDLGMLSALLRWHELDPVDDYEKHRNNLIYENFQKNRNPFIDFPEWVNVAFNNTEDKNANPSTDSVYGSSSSTTINVTGISLSPKTLNLTVGGSSSTITPTISPSNATNQGITWISNNTNIATVSNNGVVSPVGVGQATITATTNDGDYQDTCTINVSSFSVSVDGISVSPTTLSLTVNGSSQSLIPTISPSSATNQQVTWSSSDTSVANVSSGGVVSPVGAGSCQITVTTVDGGYVASCSVTVSSSPVSDQYYEYNLLTNYTTYATSTNGWTTSYASHELTYLDIDGESSTLPNATVYFSSANKPSTSSNINDRPVSKNGRLVFTLNTPETYISEVEVGFKQWTSKVQHLDLYNSSDEAGTIVDSYDFTSSTTNEEGTLNTTFTLSEQKQSFSVSPTNASNQIGWSYIKIKLHSGSTPINVSSFDVSPSNQTIYAGQTIQYEVTNILPTDASNKSVTWSINATNNCATIDENGLLTALLNSGTYVVTATANDGSNVSNTASGTVLVATLSSISVTTPPTITTYTVGDALDLSGIVVSATFSNGLSTPIPFADLTFNPANGTILNLTNTNVTITYQGMNTNQAILVQEASSNEYSLVKNVANIHIGDSLLISYTSNNVLMSTEQKTSNRGVTTADTLSADYETYTLSDTSTAAIFTVLKGINEGTYALYDHVNNGYLYAASSSSNYLRTESSLSLNSSFAISINKNNVASIVAQGSNTRNTIKYNSSSTLFACYNTSITTSMKDVSIYRKSGSEGLTQANNYANSFLNATNVCDPLGMSNNITTSLWTSLSTSYTSLRGDAKELLFYSLSNQDGNAMERCVARYDYIVVKYSTSETPPSDFMNRNPTSAATNVYPLVNIKTISPILIIVALSISVLIIINAYIIVSYKKRVKK